MGFLYYDVDNDMPDMFGKVAIVTGGSSGIGYEICKQLCKKQAMVYMAVRNIKEGERAVECILRDVPWAKVTPMYIDMASQATIRDFVTEFLALGKPLHVLVNNAGISMPGPFEVSEDGFELTLATNYFGACYLTLLLQDLLMASAPSRIINMSSVEEQLTDVLSDIDWNNLAGLHLGESATPAYAKSKMYTIAWSYELDRRLKGSGVDIFAVHPGIVRSRIQDKANRAFSKTWISWALAAVHGQTPRTGAISTLYAATDPWLQGRGGRYIGPNPTGLQLFGLAGSNTATRWPINWHLWLPHHRQRIFDTTFSMLRPALPPTYTTHAFMLQPYLPSGATNSALLAREVTASHGGNVATAAAQAAAPAGYAGGGMATGAPVQMPMDGGATQQAADALGVAEALMEAAAEMAAEMPDRAGRMDEATRMPAAAAPMGIPVLC